MEETGLIKVPDERGLAVAKTDEERDAAAMMKVAQHLPMIPGEDKPHTFRARKLGNIHLGVKVQRNGVEYPSATDYFVLPDNLRNDVEFRAKLEEIGTDPDKPTRLPIWFMSNTIAENLRSCWELYGTGGKLKYRTEDKRTAVVLNEKTLVYEQRAFQESDMKQKGIARVHKLLVMLPDAAGDGYWQIITKSDNNRGHLARRMVELLEGWLQGRLAGVDLILSLDNSRTFHIPAKERDGSLKKGPDGKPFLMPTAPYLLHLDSPHSLRKLINSIKGADSFTAPDIEYTQDTEDDTPVMSGPEWEEPAEGEIVGAEDYPADDPESERQSLLQIVAVMVDESFESEPLKTAFLRGALKGTELGDATLDQLNEMKQQLNARNRKGGQ